MFTGKPLPPLLPIIQEAGWAAGFIDLCPQARLMFGSDRRTPVAFRPVVEVRRDGVRMVVLPCTSRDQSRSADFFELTPERVMWTRPEAPRSFAFCRYEAVSCDVLHERIGVMPHPARIELLKWLKERC